jgi:serine/threonine protein kinase
VIAGRYTLDREIGRGGMGAVWVGRDEVLGRDVALKKIGMSPGAEQPDLIRAEREAKLAARVNHPHVVAVYDLVDEGDEQWLVMELVEGLNLAALVRRDGPMPPDRAAALLGQAAEALAEAHNAGIIHRDVKPSNILVTETGQVKLTDFGIARAEADASLTQTGLVTGSPAYLAPEVASGHPATEASDVWSLGATLFHALEGRPPYDVADNVMGTMFRIVNEDPPRPDHPGWLAPLMVATMAKTPGDRWAMRDVQQFLQRGPAGATAPLPPTRVATPPVPGPDRTSVLAAAPVAASSPPLAPAPRRPPPGRSRRRGGAGFLAGAGVAALVAIAVLVTALFVGNGDDTPEANDPDGSGDSTSASEPTESASSPSESSSEDAERALAMTSFVQDYLQTVVDDPKAAWPMLTPEFQRASGGFGQYKKFWDSVDGADVTDIGADGTLGTVQYSVSYSREDGNGFDDDVELQLQDDGDSFLIAGETG